MSQANRDRVVSGVIIMLSGTAMLFLAVLASATPDFDWFLSCAVLWVGVAIALPRAER